MPSDLVLNPDFVMETTPEYSTLVTTFENGVEQRRPRRASAINSFVLTYKNRSSTDMNTILTLFNAKQGSYASFTWDNPEDGNTYTVRFKQDSFKRSYHNYGLWDFTFELIVVL
jgi:uncharacterized protein (TIGR02217 family)